MRRFHYKRNPDFCPGVNVDRLWSMMPEGVYEKAKASTDVVPVIDVTKLVIALKKPHRDVIVIVVQGYFKVLGKGVLPSMPLVVKAKYFTKEVILFLDAYGVYI